ncbi:MAG: Long-chain acyl-CoA thioesterase FadM [Bacteroidia bacterium]|nr:Long-chain acyl-CoA thioesterase FadM [Bacteroidia bacterium]
MSNYRESQIEIKVRGYHLDVYQHVNNARYLELLEEGRWAHYEGRLESDFFTQNKLGMVVVNNNINYHYPATLGEVLIVKTKIEHVGNKSVRFRQQLFLKGTDKLVIDASVTFVIMDMKTIKSVPIEGKIKELLEA